jgi:hypothetical protein
MSKYFKIADLEKLSILSIYHQLLKNMKLYPSVNRHNILLAIQEEFHENKNVTGERQKKERKKAEMGLRHVLYYIEKNQDLLKNKYHNTDEVEPFAKKRQDNIYF